MSINRKVFKELPKAALGNPNEDPKKKLSKEEERAQQIQQTIDWLNANPVEGYDPSKIKYKGPGNVAVTGRYRSDKPDELDKLFFNIPEAGRYNPKGLVQMPDDYSGLPVFQVEDSEGHIQYFVNDPEFMKEYHHFGTTGHGRKKQLVGLWGSGDKFANMEEGGEVKHLMFNKTDEKSLSLNNKSGMKRDLKKAQDGMEAPSQEQGQGQMEQVVQQVQQMLQQASPQEVIAQLLQQVGDPNAVVQIMAAATQTSPEQMGPAVQEVMQQLQGQSSEGQQPQGDPNAQPQGEQPMMNDGGIFNRYGDKDWWEKENHFGTENLGEDVGFRSKKEARQLARTINQRIRDGFVGDNGLNYGEFAKVKGRDFRINNDVPSFAGGGEHMMPDGSMMSGQSHAEYMADFKGDINDFDQVRNYMVKKYRDGGKVDENALNPTSTEEYLGGLTEAIKSHLFAGYAVNTIGKQFKEISNNVMPMAADGMVTPENVTEILNAYGYTQEQYDTDPKIKAEVDATSRGGQGRIFPKETTTTSVPNTASAENLRRLPSQSAPKHYYPGHGPGLPNDVFGYQREKFSMSPLARMFGSFGREQGPAQARGFGEFEGSNIQDFLNAIGSTHEITNVDPVYKTNIFGKEKRHLDKNIIGQSYTTRRIGMGDQPTFTPIANQQSPMQPSSLENALGMHNATMDDYNSNPELKREIDRLMRGNQSIAEAEDFNWDQNRWDRKQSREARRNPVEAGFEPVNSIPKQTVDDKWQEAKIKAGLEGIDDSQLTDDQWDKIDELYQYMCGGVTHNGKELKKAANGYEVSQDNHMTFNPREFAYGLEDSGYALADFLDRLNMMQSNEQMAINRSPDAMFKPVPGHSGDEGIYWENLQRQMGQDMGADVLPGTGSDMGSFSQRQQGLKGDFFGQQFSYADGGESGIKEGDDLILNDDQMKKLESLGYKLNRLY